MSIEKEECPECGSTDIKISNGQKYCGECDTVFDLYDTEPSFTLNYGNTQTRKEKELISNSRKRARNENKRDKQRVIRKYDADDYFDEVRDEIDLPKELKDNIQKDYDFLYNAFFDRGAINGRNWSKKTFVIIILGNLLLDRFNREFIKLLEFCNEKFNVLVNFAYTKEAIELYFNCRKYKELHERLIDYAKSKRIDAENLSVELAKRLKESSFYYMSSKIDPKIKDNLDLEELVTFNNKPRILLDVLESSEAMAWASFYRFVNHFKPKHKMTGLFCVCLYREIEKIQKECPKYFKIKAKTKWAKYFGISYELLNIRLKNIENL
jgi:uncharacterized Zn finger protein (UPF0148 family)